MTPLIVRVGSRNPVKVEAVARGFEAMFSGAALDVAGVQVASGVSDQPMSDRQTFDGAWNRAHNTYRQCLDDSLTPAYTLGIEGGCSVEPDERIAVFAWVVVYQPHTNRRGRSKTATFYLPDEVAALVKQGIELGEADDRVFQQENSKQDNGSVGLLTDNALTRADYYTQAVILALIPFTNPGLTFG